jgi:hypothetical protein
LSTNDYTTAEKNKLAGIEAGADKTPDLSHYVTDSDYDPDSKTSDQTQPVGVDSNGKLWTATGGSTITVDNALSDSSTNPVQNKVVKAALNGKGTYSKPSGGIPASDLAAGVIPTVPTKTSELQNDSGFVDASGAASAAPVQSVNGQTGAVTVNVPSAASSGTPAMDGTASRGSSTQYARADHRHPSDTTKYTKPSTGIPKSDLAAAVQDSLGKADKALQEVPSAYRTAADQDTIDAGKADKITEITVSTAGAVTQALDAGKIYHFTGALTALTITLNATIDLAQYHFDFNCGSTAPTVTIPSAVTMPDSQSFEANKHYEVDILNNYGAVISWATS